MYFNCRIFFNFYIDFFLICSIILSEVTIMGKKEIINLMPNNYSIHKNCICKNNIQGKDNITLCNFWISDFTIYYIQFKNRKINTKFSITVENKNNEQTMVFPIDYLPEIEKCFNYFLDLYDFSISSDKITFKKAMTEICHSIKEYKELPLGWEIEKETLTYNKSTLAIQHIYHANYFWDLEEIAHDKHYDNTTSILKYIDSFTSPYIGTPLFAYTLLSIIKFLGITDKNEHFNFVMSLVGSTSKIRERVALFCCDIHNRIDSEYNKSNYRDTHIFPNDSILDMRLKAALAKDSIVIAFNPTVKQTDNLYKIYSEGVYNGDIPSHGTLLFVQSQPIFSKNSKDLKIVEIDLNQIKNHNNINTILNKELKYAKYSKNFSSDIAILYDSGQKEDDDLINDIRSFIAYLSKKTETTTDYVKDKYQKFCCDKSADNRYMNLPDDTRGIALKLNFALFLYCKYCNSKKSDNVSQEWFNEHEKIILDIIEKSVLSTQGKLIRSKSEEISHFCSYINAYMQKNKKFVAKANKELKIVTNINFWCDDEYIFMTAQTIKNTLKLMGADIAFDKPLKELLAKENIIKTYNINNRIEYSTHYQKPLYGTLKTRDRFIMFNRETCRKYNLFPYIEDMFPINVQINNIKLTCNIKKVEDLK